MVRFIVYCVQITKNERKSANWLVFQNFQIFRCLTDRFSHQNLHTVLLNFQNWASPSYERTKFALNRTVFSQVLLKNSQITSFPEFQGFQCFSESISYQNVHQNLHYPLRSLLTANWPSFSSNDLFWAKLHLKRDPWLHVRNSGASYQLIITCSPAPVNRPNHHHYHSFASSSSQSRRLSFSLWCTMCQLFGHSPRRQLFFSQWAWPLSLLLALSTRPPNPNPSANYAEMAFLALISLITSPLSFDLQVSGPFAQPPIVLSTPSKNLSITYRTGHIYADSIPVSAITENETTSFSLKCISHISLHFQSPHANSLVYSPTLCSAPNIGESFF